MVDINPVNKNTVVNVNSSGSVSEIKTTTPQHYYDGLAKQWAISADKVQGLDYSSKYYAEKSRESAQNAQVYVEQVNNVKNEAITEINTNKGTATNEINNAKNSAVMQLSKEAQEQLKNIKSTGFYMRDDKLYFINSEGEEEEFKSGAGAVMFDTKISDHILEGEEALGWALQGTYVSKETYPDFYNKCLDEYKNSTEEIIGVEPWTQPIATANTTSVDGGNMVISASSEYTGSQEYAWKAMDGNTTSTHFSLSSTNTGWWQVKFPYKLLIKGLTYYSRAKASTYPVETATFYTSSDMTQQIGDTFSAPTTDYTAFEVQNIPQDGVITDTIYLSLKGDGSTCGMGELVINAQKLTSDIYYTIYKNNNGHKFYPIEQKSAFDTIYNQYGIADFYGIDEENERVFLPRNKYFHQLTLNTSEVNEMVEAGLPNITGTFKTMTGASGAQPTGAFNMTSSRYAVSSNVTNGQTIDLNASRSSSIYGNSDTVQPPSSLKLLYYCVGNTEVTQAITNVTEITTSENDTIPLFTGMYFDFKPNNASWLKAGEQQNSAGIYKTCYDTLVEIVNGVNNYDLKVINQADMVSGVVYDEYWILDQDNLTFRTPLTISSRTYESIAPVVGNGKALGVMNSNKVLCSPNLRGAGDSNYWGGWTTYGDGALTSATLGATGIYGRGGVTTDPTKSGIEAHLVENTTAQLYFKVANAVQNLELLDAGEVLEGLANVVPNNSSLIASYAMPSNKYIDLTLGASGSTYTAPANGWIYWVKFVGSDWYYINVRVLKKGVDKWQTVADELYSAWSSDYRTSSATILIPIKKGYKYETHYNATGKTVNFRFIYAEGEQ